MSKLYGAQVKWHEQGQQYNLWKYLISSGLMSGLRCTVYSILVEHAILGEHGDYICLEDPKL